MSSFGKYTYGDPKIQWQNSDAKLIVKNFTSIAENVTINLGNGCGHDTSFVSTYPFSFIHRDIFVVENKSRNTRGDVIIGNDVWIGENVVIMSGVTIGDGAVIANNSHVHKNIEPFSINGGNPCQKIKYRLAPEQIERLVEIKWWDWSDEKIRFYLPWICSPNVDDFLLLVEKGEYEKSLVHDEPVTEGATVVVVKKEPEPHHNFSFLRKVWKWFVSRRTS